MNSKQKIILRNLVIKNGLRYSELSKNFQPEDRFHYHLKHLIKIAYVLKRDNKYFLTREGLQFTKNFNSRNLQDEVAPHLLFGFIITYQDNYHLTYDFINKISGTPSWYRLIRGTPLIGESTHDSCKRILQQKARLESTSITYMNTYRLVQLTTNQSVIFDNILLMFIVEVTEDSYKASSELSTQKTWFTRNEIKELDSKWPEVNLITRSADYSPMQEIRFVSDYTLETEEI